ncbi:hypothetical protein NUSPORA_01449 [Nucleospora cyclopteri]
MFTTIDDFELGKPLGIGRFGQVWLAKHKKENFICALKILELENFKNTLDVKNIRREIEIQLNLSHPNILGMYGYFYDSLRLYCVLEYAGNGDLWKKVKTEEKLNEIEAKKCIKQIANALEYLHKQNIIHRDIKPENILIGCDNNFKLCDFGWSVHNTDQRRGTFCGTAEYLSPEMCQDKVYDKSVDVWALGILAYELSTGSCPLSSSDTKVLSTAKSKIINEEIKFPNYLSPALIDFIQKCTKKDPKNRITIEEALKHSFLNK